MLGPRGRLTSQVDDKVG